MIKLLIIFGTFIPIYLFEEININNCINGANFTTECGYNINFNNIGNKNIDCNLNFISSNPTVQFNNTLIKVKSEEANKCPIIDLNIITIGKVKTKDNKLSTTCGGEIEKLDRIFSNFSSFVIKLDTKGLNDQDSKVNMNLMIAGECRESGESWISWIRKNFYMILIIFTIVLIILVTVVVVCCCCCCRKKDYRAVDKEKKQLNIRKDKMKNKNDNTSDQFKIV